MGLAPHMKARHVERGRWLRNSDIAPMINPEHDRTEDKSETLLSTFSAGQGASRISMRTSRSVCAESQHCRGRCAELTVHRKLRLCAERRFNISRRLIVMRPIEDEADRTHVDRDGFASDLVVIFILPSLARNKIAPRQRDRAIRKQW